MKAKEEQAPAYVPKAEWNILENTGRRYAKVSGDFNLIHIHAIMQKHLVLSKPLRMVCGAS